MVSKESQAAAQVRLSQWALEIQECQNRPRDMTVKEWCEQRGITKANYYWRLKRVRQACLKQLESSSDNFVELPVPALQTISAAPVSTSRNDNPSTVALLHAAGGISIEIKENATAGFIKNLIGALANA